MKRFVVSRFKYNGSNMAQLRLDLQGCGEVHTFEWPRIQSMDNGVQLVLSVARQIRFLRRHLRYLLVSMRQS